MASVLAVDDSKSMRHMLSQTFCGAGFNVVKASNGSQALIEINTSNPDVIIADIEMPNLDGLAFTREVRKLPHCKDIPIILISTDSKTSSEARSSAKAAGATGWMCKPVDPDQLLQTVHAILK